MLNSELISSAAHVLVKDIENVELDDETTHHLSRVLRIHHGESVTATDGNGSWRVMEASAPAKNLFLLKPKGDVRREVEPSPRLGIAFAPLTRSATSQLVQQCTEAGVDDLYPIITAFTNTDVDSLRTDRLQKIVAESVAQSRRVWLPILHEPSPWVNFISKHPEIVRADFDGEQTQFAEATIIAIGPEGGWSGTEREKTPKTINLGDTVLRAETAAVVAAASLVKANRSD
jgi:16S rRNA (uracil1498-N3)-methyltransferase